MNRKTNSERNRQPTEKLDDLSKIIARAIRGIIAETLADHKPVKAIHGRGQADSPIHYQVALLKSDLKLEAFERQVNSWKTVSIGLGIIIILILISS